MQKILIICGPTATGKTRLALHFAHLLDGELISADSRQVYRGMDIATGKDLPVNFKFQIFRPKDDRPLADNFQNQKIPYYTDGKVRIWGLDLVNPDEEFSVAHFRQFAKTVITDIQKRRKLPIIVGGTGLYIKALLEPLTAIPVPRNDALRSILENASVATLQKKLQEIDRYRFERMNNSDRNNPRRLIRAIEVEEYYKANTTHKTHMTQVQKINNTLMIGLTAAKETISDRISKRVEERLKQGMVDEVKKLLDSGFSKDLPSMSATGYKHLISNFKYQINTNKYQYPIKEEIINAWKQEELQYAKRQLTWFKKQKGIIWFDTQRKNWEKTVVDRVKEWYTGENIQ